MRPHESAKFDSTRIAEAHDVPVPVSPNVEDHPILGGKGCRQCLRRST